MAVAADVVLAALALLLALAVRPWRAWGTAGPPWPWLAWATLMPVLWTADRLAQAPIVQPLSGVCLLMLMAGWPTAILVLLPVTLLAAWLGGLDATAALDRSVWLGVVPATLAVALGATIRRWLPNHLMVYILGRGFFATLAATWFAGWLALQLHGGIAGLRDGDLLLGRWLAAWSDAIITGMVVSIFVAFRPQWLATYADRLYLPRQAARQDAGGPLP